MSIPRPVLERIVTLALEEDLGNGDVTAAACIDPATLGRAEMRARQPLVWCGAELVREVFPLTPSGIIKHLDLRRPIYRKTAAGGHFGRNEPEFTWEKTDMAKKLAQAAEADAVAT